MPLALAAALLASLGLHVALLLLPDVTLPSAPEPAPVLQAEIVLRPRALPVPPPVRATSRPQRPPVAARPVPAPSEATAPMPAATAERETTDATATPAAGDAAVSPPGDALPTPAVVAPPPTAPPLESPQLPDRGEIRYFVYRGQPPTLIGSAVQRWELIADEAGGPVRYRLLSEMETAGLAALIRDVRLVSESEGILGADGLEPARYASRQVVDGRARNEEVIFDRAASRVRFSRGGEAPLPAGAQDLLSFNYQLGWLARTGDMAIATTRKIDNYRLELVGKEWIETPSRPMWTLHFRAAGETTTEVWLTPDNYLLPVKIRHIDKKGERFEQVADEIRLGPP